MLSLPKRVLPSDLEAWQGHEGYAVYAGSFTDPALPERLYSGYYSLYYRHHKPDLYEYLAPFISDAMYGTGIYQMILWRGWNLDAAMENRDLYWFGAFLDDVIYGPLAHFLFQSDIPHMKRYLSRRGVKLYLGDTPEAHAILWEVDHAHTP